MDREEGALRLGRHGKAVANTTFWCSSAGPRAAAELPAAAANANSSTESDYRPRVPERQGPEPPPTNPKSDRRHSPPASVRSQSVKSFSRLPGWGAKKEIPAYPNSTGAMRAFAAGEPSSSSAGLQQIPKAPAPAKATAERRPPSRKLRTGNRAKSPITTDRDNRRGEW